MANVSRGKEKGFEAKIKCTIRSKLMERKAWGAFRYEVFPAYDFVPIAAHLKEEHA